MNPTEITKLSKTLKVTDLLCYVAETRETGSANIPADIFCAVQVAGYIRGKLNGQNVFITTERVGRRYKMYMRFHNGRAVSRKDFSSVTSDTVEPKGPMQATPALWFVLDTFPITQGLEPIMHSPKPLSYEDATVLRDWLESHRCLTGKPECFELCEA